MKASPSRGQGVVSCPICDDDSEGLATIGHDTNERGSTVFLEAFVGECGHTLADLTPAQEGIVLEAAAEWVAEALDALMDAHWDQRLDAARDDR